MGRDGHVVRLQRRLGDRRGAVLLIADVFSPRNRTALVIDLLHRKVRHEAVRGGAVPVLFAGSK